MMICQVARGMERLEALGIVHRDLAARWKIYLIIILYFFYILPGGKIGYIS